MRPAAGSHECVGLNDSVTPDLTATEFAAHLRALLDGALSNVRSRKRPSAALYALMVLLTFWAVAIPALLAG